MDSYQAAVEQVKEIGTKLDKDMNELTAMQDDYEKQQADVETAIVALENQKEQYASQIAQAQQQAENYQNIITAQGKIIQEQEAAAAAAAAQAAAARANSSSSSSSYDGGGAGKGGSIAGDYAAGGGKNPGASTGVSGNSVSYTHLPWTHSCYRYQSYRDTLHGLLAYMLCYLNCGTAVRITPCNETDVPATGCC